MKKFDTLNRLIDGGVVAVVRADSKEQGAKIAEACVQGGIKAIELTFTVPHADQVIAFLKDTIPSEKLIIGAGTVLDAVTARIAILNGAEYIVSPSFDLETAKLCNRYQIPYMSGCETIKEIITAMEAGVDIVKLFPGSAFGPCYVKAVKGPLPQCNIMPTGGVSIDNAAEWIKAGCVAIGVGGDLTAPAKNGDYAGVTAKAKEYVDAVRSARGGK